MSMKGLSNLVCESSVRASENVLNRELGRNLGDLSLGVLAFGPPPSGSQDHGQSDSSKKLGTFIRELSHFLQVSEDKSRKILSTYLAGDFRGTKDSLKKLTSEDRFRKPLLRDIWFFYRAERLYLLQVLKEIFSHARSTEHKHAEIFEGVFNRLRNGDVLLRSLIDQLKHVLTEVPPNRDTMGKFYSEDIVATWVHVNLREVVEILQLLLLYFYNLEGDELAKPLSADDFLDLLKLFQVHGFCRKVSPQLSKVDVDPQLSEAVGALEAFLIICLIDLPKLTTGVTSELRSKCSEIDRIVAGLGSKPDHSPIMMSWMLAHYLMDDDLAKFQSLGERAVQLQVLKFLNRSLQNSVVVANTAVSHVVHSAAFSVVSVLVSAFEPSRMKLEKDVDDIMCTLIKDRRIATAFWKLGFESGLGLVFESKLSRFPAEMSSVLEVCVALAEAGPESADEVLACLESLSCFAEPVENVPMGDLVHKGGGNQFELCANRSTHSLQIPKGTRVSSDGKFYYFLINFDGIKYLIGEACQLVRQASQGANRVNQVTLSNVVNITKLMEVLLRNGSACLQTQGHSFSKVCFLLVEKVVRLPSPPIDLLAHCLKSLSLIASQRPHSVWEKLSETGIFPFLTNSLGYGTNDVDVTPGIVGALLAQFECVRGTYPLTMAYLDLLLSCITLDTIGQVRPSIIYVIQDIFPSYRQWRFEVVKDREIFGQKLLRVIRRVVAINNPLQKLGIESLMSPAPSQTLLAIASTGDRVIQSLYESQSSMEGGVGVELSRSVHLSLSILNILLQKTGIDNLVSLKQVLCSPPQGSKPHFILTVAHYLYHLQSCDLPLAAVNLMSTVATILPMSLLACLGSDAEAIRDILIHRLEAQTEDTLLKIAIIKFFSSCVDSQPGLIQLLIGVKNNVTVVNPRPGMGLTASETIENESVELLDNRGCLSAILDLLHDVVDKTDVQSTHDDLHVALVEFIFCLWSNQRIVALSYLKKQDKFWEILSQPLFQASSASKPKLIGCILRILSSEIYTYKGQVDADLKTVLEKLLDENSGHVEDWFQDENETEVGFLLSSWKSFLVVLAHDQPITVTPKQSQKVIASLIKAIRKQIKASDQDIHVTTALSETCLVLMQRWQTKCAEKMEAFIQEQGDLLAESNLSFEQLNNRSRSAILGMASISLKFSSFKMEKEDEVLSGWLRPIVCLVEKSLAIDQNNEDSNQLILSLSLLQNLLSRFSSSTWWQSVLHERSVVQSLLSTLHHAIRARNRVSLARHCLGVLILISRTEYGCDALLEGSNLSQMLWLPLASIDSTALKEDWTPVFHLSIHLAATLLRLGKHRALENSICVVTLLQDHLSSFLLSLQDGIQRQKLDLTLVAADFITNLMKYFKQWQLHHSSSLVHFYRLLCLVMHRSICLLIRPSLLSVLLGQQEKQKANNHSPESTLEKRVRRRLSSSADYQDGGSDVISPEATCVQNSLLDVVSSCLNMLLALSPDLLALVTDDLVDCAAFEQLLHVGFATPSFEQDESNGLSYGTVISVCNLCIRTLTRSSDNSSPARSGSDSGSIDRRKTIVVLEKALTLVLAQALLFLSDHRLMPRDKQLIRRELSAELGSVTENMRRYIHRGTKSPHPEVGSVTTPPRLAKSDENFIKFVATIVQKAFK